MIPFFFYVNTYKFHPLDTYETRCYVLSQSVVVNLVFKKLEFPFIESLQFCCQTRS